ncbi:unnamed protein product [Amoebophrya sp. A120]|nr:unnamed protein product [Amoebophrya sp. A120]|eukprot:GSA120T00003529001.1
MAASLPTAAEAGNAGEKQEVGKKKTFSDLLLGSGKTATFDGWLGELENVEAESRALRYQKLVVGAQVNAWQFGMLHQNKKRVEEAAREGKSVPVVVESHKRFPLDVVNRIRAFIGNVERRPTAIMQSDELMRISDRQRGRDYKLAAEYFVNLARKEAERGGDKLLITEAHVASMPKLSEGIAPCLGNVFAILYDRDYTFTSETGDGREFHPSRSVNFPYDSYPIVMQFNETQSAQLQTGFMREIVKELEAGRGHYQAPSLPVGGGGGSSSTVGSNNLSTNRFFGAFEAALRVTRDEVANYITDLALQAFANADANFVLTEEIYDAAPRLPNGVRYPMFDRDLEAVHARFEDRFEFRMLNHLRTFSGLQVVPQFDNDFVLHFPVTISAVP